MILQYHQNHTSKKNFKVHIYIYNFLPKEIHGTPVMNRKVRMMGLIASTV